MTTSVPLNKLNLSPRNARKTNGDEDIEALADSIQSKGLLQNLVVSEGAGGKGLYEVDAGGRYEVRGIIFDLSDSGRMTFTDDLSGTSGYVTADRYGWS